MALMLTTLFFNWKEKEKEKEKQQMTISWPLFRPTYRQIKTNSSHPPSRLTPSNSPHPLKPQIIITNPDITKIVITYLKVPQLKPYFKVQNLNPTMIFTCNFHLIIQSQIDINFATHIFNHFPNIRCPNVDITFFNDLTTNIISLINLKYVTNLRLYGNDSIFDLTILNKCTNLRHLKLSKWVLPELSNSIYHNALCTISSPLLNWLGNHGRRQTRDTKRFHEMKRAALQQNAYTQSPFSNCTKLKSIHMFDVTVMAIYGLEMCENLRTLTLTNCCELRSVPTCGSMRRLIVDQCCNLQNLDGLRGSEKLQDIHILWCENLENTEGLAHCKKLDKVKVDCCDKLAGVPLL